MTTPGNLDMEAFRKMMWAMMDEVVTKQTAVSYTHLDVYKRQFLDHRCF